MQQTARILISFLILILFGSFLHAQSTVRKKEKEPSPIGFGANLGNIRFFNNTFQFGLSPNIAYRFSPSFAAGFMLKADYYSVRYPSFNLRFSALDLGPTVFTRWKPLVNMDGATPFLRGIFIQAEYERALIARESTDEFGNLILNDKGNRIKTVRSGEDYLYLGLGLSSGYPFSTVVSIHYNVIDMATLSRIPFDYRFGFTYNY